MVRALIATGFAVVALAVAGSGCGGYDGDGTSTTSAGGSVLAGRWTGTLHQKGLDPFTLTATITSATGTAGNRVHYTGINCSGHWTYMSEEGQTSRLREVIDRGRGGKCKGVGVVSLTPASDDRLDYVFRGGGVVSRGILHRTR